MSKLIAIDAGHGLHTAGKRTPDGEREWSFNNKVVIALIKELHRLGLRTVRLDDPSGQRDVPLGERTRKANNVKADVLVSVHHNALTGRWGSHTGTEIYSYPNAKSSADLAKKLQPILSTAYGLRNRGAKTANFHMLRESNMPAILTEGGYMDSRIDIVKLRDNEVLKQAGINIARGVANYLGVSVSGGVKPNTSTSPKKPTQPTKQANTGGSIVDYLNSIKINSSFANRKKLAREYLGISNYSGTAKQNTDLLSAMRKGKPKPVAKPKPQTTNKLAVDGYWGPATTRALQRHYGTVVDGKITGQPNNASVRNIPSATTSSTGSLLVRAMQRDVGTIVDGKISAPSLMIRALQKRLGTPVDGRVSKPSLMVKEMQRRLNNGTF